MRPRKSDLDIFKLTVFLDRPYHSYNDEYEDDDSFERGSVASYQQVPPYPPRTTSRSDFRPGLLRPDNPLPSFPLKSSDDVSNYDIKRNRPQDFRQDESNAQYSQTSTKNGGRLLEKMNTITPGPFGVSGSSHGTKKSISERPGWGHQRNLTSSSLSSSGSFGARGVTSHPGPEVNPMLKRSKTDGPGLYDGSGSRQNQGTGFLRPGERSQTLPNLANSRSADRSPVDPYSRRPSEPYSRDDPPNINKPSKDRTMTTEYSVGNPYHTPTESQSSSGSANSDAKTGSSRSSPPLSDASGKIARKPIKTTNIDNLMEDIQESMETLQARDDPSGKHLPAPIDSQYNRSAPSARPDNYMPESPMDPAVQGGYISRDPRYPYPSQSSNILPVRAPTTASKGACRGCREPIIGKSVSSADGRLTGRYHKQCMILFIFETTRR